MNHPVDAPPKARSLVRSILTVASGSALGSLIGIAVSPALTRLFTPGEFGVFAVAAAVVMVLLTLVTGRMELAVPLPSKDSEARDLLLIGATIAVLTISALVLVALLAPDLAAEAGPESLDGMFLAVPVLLVPVASFHLLNAWAIRQSRYRAIATRNVAQASVTAVAQLGFGLLGHGVWGLVAGYFIGQLVGALTLLHRSGLLSLGPVSRSALTQTARTYRRHPLVLAPSGFVNVLGAQAPVLIIAATYGATAAGLMALTQRVLAVPVTLVGTATAQVYLSELALGKRSGDFAKLLPLFWRTTKLLGLLAVGLVLVGAPVSYFAFGPIFGAEWAEAGTVAALLTAGVAAQLVGSSVSQTLIVFQRLWAVAAWDVGRLVATCVVLTVAWWLGATLVEAVGLLSITMVITYVVYWWLSHRTLVVYGAHPGVTADTSALEREI